MSGRRDRNEAARLAVLHDLALLDTGPETGFDDLVALARALTGAAGAGVGFVDADRQWFKAREGIAYCEAPRSSAFCDYAIRGRDVFVVLDAAADPRFAGNPFVAGEPFIRFYAGAPIVTADGHALGVVSVVDSAPRDRFEQAGALAALARQASVLIELRRMARADAALRADVLRDRDRLWTLSHDLMLVCDLDGCVMAANPSWQKVFGPLRTPGAVRMRQFLADPEMRPDLRTIRDGEAISITRDYSDHGGDSRTISWTLRREGVSIYAIGRDDTALRHAEAELQQAHKMESLGQLTGGIAHDFNNLLTIIVGNLDIAKRRLRDGDEARVERALSDAGEGAARAAVLTQRLLAFARRQRLAPRVIGPGELLSDMRPLIERAVSETVELELAVDEGLWPVEIDVSQLETAIINLAVNARDAMAGGTEGGRLRVSAANAAVDDREAGRQGVAAGDFVRLSVADTGTGMTGEVLARAFEPFFTTKGVGRGTGLGLSQVHGFVRQSGGFVTIDTRPGQGTAVHLWLPRSGKAHAPVAPSPAVPPEPAQAVRAATVMVVEDNDALREMVVETLREAGYRVIEAHDGHAALSLFARQVTPPDLLLSDVMMPRLDGFALAAEVQAREPRTRVLLMSGYAGIDRAGSEPLLVKPFTPDALLARIAALIDGGDRPGSAVDP